MNITCIAKINLGHELFKIINFLYFDRFPPFLSSFFILFFLSKTTSSFLNRSCCYHQKFFVRKYMDVFHNNLHPEAAQVLQQFWEGSEAATGDILLRKGVLRNFAKFTGKHHRQNLYFNKVADLRPATLLKKRLWHRCFPGNFAKFLRHLFYRTCLSDCFWRVLRLSLPASSMVHESYEQFIKIWRVWNVGRATFHKSSYNFLLYQIHFATFKSLIQSR